MNSSRRVAGIILALLLLVSSGGPALASPKIDEGRVGRTQTSVFLDLGDIQQGEDPGVPPHRERPEKGTPPPTISPPWQSPAPDSTEGAKGEDLPVRLEPALVRALLEATPDEQIRVIVHLRQQADLEAAVGGALNATQARSRVVSALQSNAARSQAPLRAYLEGAQAAGLAESYTPFWIFNGIAVRARPSLVRALSTHPSVAVVRLDHYRRWVTVEAPDPKPQTHDAQSEIEWNVARVRADQVWASLNVSGTGAVVAGMDTGVDWLHPALQANYRGYNPHGPANHTYSWHDAIGDGALYPVDGHSHGSHTLGTTVGQGGIGVAPGAQWIGVRVLNNQGNGYDSWIHDGFQWLLAPGGDPSQAPDVVNCSWGNNNGSLTTFQPDLQALRAAGIVAVFANGNNGPDASSVDSPASLPEAFAVGATDSDDEVASFSSRGPSPWGEIRPHVVAPGVDVRSSLPGGAYGSMNGTSMAAPHVSGIAAFLRSADPTVSITHTAFLITSTVIPLGDPVPNNDSGWGRVDAFAAVVALAQSGFISGTVKQSGGDTPVAGATVSATPHGAGSSGTATTDADGRYSLALAPATYDVSASAFGHAPSTSWGVVVTTHTTSIQDFSLDPLPTGTLRGQITDAGSGTPITATVAVLGTPFEATASAYTFALPAGTYTVRAHRLGYRVVTTTAQVQVDQTTTANLALPPSPTILLVDSGPWAYDSQIGYFRQALDDLAYTYDEWSIKHLPDEVPTAADLSPYDVAVWSAPSDAPGLIGAGGTITGYLSTGGRLLLSGQDVGFLDDSGVGGYLSPYYREYLKARYVSDNAEGRVLEGTEGDIFAGLTITITGAGGADNQDYPDEVTVADPDAAAPLLTYSGGGCGGIRAGTCLDYRSVYLSFGFEAINDRAARRELMNRALDWLVSPSPTAGIELTPLSQTHIGLPGSIITHALRVRHVGQAGGTDTIDLSLDDASWNTQLSAPSLSLAPCTSSTVVVSVSIPSTAGWDARDVATLTARSSLSPTLVKTAVITSKVPAPILLVDDDRWYDQEDKYEAALASAGFAYDYWHTGKIAAEAAQGSPPSHVLQRYPIVTWFTGYDWYEPVTAEEETTLAAYLDGGGRLFLSSQDFLYYHHEDSFSGDYLGVLSHTEDVTPTMAQGVPGDPIGDRSGPYLLDYPFRNWSDAVIPTPGTAVSFRDHERRAIALARQENDHKTVFFPFPFETLPVSGRSEVMEQVVGWLSWLGGSTFSTDRATVSGNETLTYTIVLRNDGPEPINATLSNTLPSSITLMVDSLTGPATHHATNVRALTQRISWSGALEAEEAITFTYRVTVAAGLPAGTPITNTARFGLEDQGIYFHRANVIRVNAPDLSPSTLQCHPSPARPSSLVTCTLGVTNAGSGDASGASIVHRIPTDAELVPGSLAWVGGGTAEALTTTVQWAGSLSIGAPLTLTYMITTPTNPVHPPLYSVAFLEDGTGETWERALWLPLKPWRSYLPMVYESFQDLRQIFLPTVMRDTSP